VRRIESDHDRLRLRALRALASFGCALLASACTFGGLGQTRPNGVIPEASTSAAVTRVYAAGDVADCTKQEPSQTAAARTAALIPTGATVLVLGDTAYPQADAATIARCYEPTWGPHRATTHAVAGNHDYVGGDAHAFRQYFGLDATGAERGFVAYSRWLDPQWLLIVLDSNAGASLQAAQLDWLRQTLAAELPDVSGRSDRCLLVAWHAPMYSSGLHRGSGEHMRAYWNLLEEYRADLLLSGHEHFYEAFEPIGADGRARADADGIRQFVVGTGGAPLFGFWRPPYASRARLLQHGVLELSLEPGRYGWRFIDMAGATLDAGSAACRRAR
jgi:hypothetical protein